MRPRQECAIGDCLLKVSFSFGVVVVIGIVVVVVVVDQPKGTFFHCWLCVG